MEPAIIKQKLHHYIASEKKLQAVYTILEGDIEGEYFYPQEELKTFYDSRQKFLSDESKSYTVDETIKLIRQNRKSNGA